MAEDTNQVWGTDFTYVFLTNYSMRYNCLALDLYDRSVVASETGEYITNDLAILTLEKALEFNLAFPIFQWDFPTSKKATIS